MTFKKGDKFILELGEERKMFNEFQIAGTDLYVKKDLLEKLTPYKPENLNIEHKSDDEQDSIRRQAIRYKLAALVNEFEEILSHIREREVNDSVCGLCEYDGAYIGQSGDWCNECTGFEKDDCFKLKEKYREEWTDING